MSTKEFERWYKSTDVFEYYNANPEGAKKRTFVWDRGDCAIRALAKASGISWTAAFDYLTERARRDFNVVNDAKAVREWLKESGAVWVACKAERGKTRMTLEEFARTHKQGSYFAQLANHFSAVVDGKIYDVWNCGCKAVVGYFTMTDINLK